MVVELILTTLVTQAVGHYAEQGFGWFDARIRDTAERAATGDAGARQAVALQLSDRLRELPRTGDGTSPGTNGVPTWTRESMVADILFDPPPRGPDRYDYDAEPLSPRMAKFVSTLDGTFRAVHEFPRSVTAVPGWFHTELCVAVIDCRARDGAWHPEVPLHWPGAGVGPYFMFEDVDGWPGDLVALRKPRTGVPRVTVIECADLDDRTLVLERLRPELTALDNEQRHWGKELLAEVTGADPSQVRAVLKLREDRVDLGPPATDVRGADEDVTAFMRRPKVGPLAVALDDPAGVRTMKADLVRQVLAEADRDAAWLDL